MAKKENLIDKAWEVQGSLERRGKQLGKGKYGRIFRIAKKPDEEEYTKTIEISIMGLLILGLVGFGIYLLFKLVGTLY
jgi:protein transport protein SEC61 subunit gamma-like protein